MGDVATIHCRNRRLLRELLAPGTSRRENARFAFLCFIGVATPSRSRVAVYRKHSLLCPLALCGTSLRENARFAFLCFIGGATPSRSRVAVYRKHSLLCPLALCGTSLRENARFAFLCFIGVSTPSRSRVAVYRRHSLLCPLALCGTSLRKKSPPGSFSLLTHNCPDALRAPLHFARVTSPKQKGHRKGYTRWGIATRETIEKCTPSGIKLTKVIDIAPERV